MRLLRAADRAVSPWKNGGGQTAQVACSPEDAGLDDFQWRVSLATVAASGPFSAFPGIDRTFLVLSGDGLRLTLGGDAPLDLDTQSAPLAFAGERDVQADLLGGPTTDLNLMVRRGAVTGTVERIEITASLRLAPEATALLLVTVGSVSATSQGATETLAALDAILIGPGEDISVGSEGDPAQACLITISGHA
jgi:environmental stress-induced protein Ves